MNKIISWALYFTAMFAPLLIWGWEADSQNPQVTVVGAVTPGHCTGFSSTLQLQDTGSVCGTAGTLQTGGFNNIQLQGNVMGSSPVINTAGGDPNISLFLSTKGSGSFGFQGNNFGANLFQINGSTTAVNFLAATPANTGAGPQLQAAGSDPNVTLVLLPKGTGNIAVAGATNPGSLTLNNVGFTAAANLVTGTTGGHLAINQSGGGTPSLTAGCNGAGSSVSGNDTNGTVTGQTAATTGCTLAFGTAYASAPNCAISGLTGPLTAVSLLSTSAISVTFASTANFKWSYVCLGT